MAYTMGRSGQRRRMFQSLSLKPRPRWLGMKLMAPDFWYSRQKWAKKMLSESTTPRISGSL